jgi:hypothetical protein
MHDHTHPLVVALLAWFFAPGISTPSLLLGDGAASESDASLAFAQRTKYSPAITRAEPRALEKHHQIINPGR